MRERRSSSRARPLCFTLSLIHIYRLFAEEIKHLTPVPTLSKPIEPKLAIIRKTNVVHYRQNRYEVPKGTYFPGRQARIEADGQNGMVCFYDKETGLSLIHIFFFFGASCSQNISLLFYKLLNRF